MDATLHNLPQKTKKTRNRTPPKNVLTEADERLVTAREVLERIPIHRTTLNEMINQGRFPAPLKLTRQKLFWRWSAILAFLEERERNPVGRREFRYKRKVG